MSIAKNPIGFLAILAIAGLLVFALYVYQATPGTVTTPVPSTFTVGGKTYAFNYTATTEAQRNAGLMNKTVTDSTTMLFAFPGYGEWQFWMYDTNTSLDMMWLNVTGHTGVVVYLVSDAQPCFDASSCQRYTPTAPANYVIEAKGGFAASHSVSAGSVFQFG